MCKFESSQKHERKVQSADFSKPYSKPRAFNCGEFGETQSIWIPEKATIALLYRMNDEASCFVARKLHLSAQDTRCKSTLVCKSLLQLQSIL